MLAAQYVHGVQTDDIVAKSTAAGTVYYHRDVLGSTVALSDASGQIVERCRYDVFGRVEIRSATRICTLTPTLFSFAAHYGSVLRAIEFDGYNRLIQLEIWIGRINKKLSLNSHRTDQKVNGGTLNTFRATSVKKSCCCRMIFVVRKKQRKCLSGKIDALKVSG